VPTLLLDAQNGSGMTQCTVGGQCFACMLSAWDISKCDVRNICL